MSPLPMLSSLVVCCGVERGKRSNLDIRTVTELS